MSAEKCGVVLTVEMLEQAAERAACQTAHEYIWIVSPRAYRMLKRIQVRYPSFDPQSETEIWWKAYSMGLTEE